MIPLDTQAHLSIPEEEPAATAAGSQPNASAQSLNMQLTSGYWTDAGNYNANWEGLINYASQTTFYVNSEADLAAFMVAITQNRSNQNPSGYFHSFRGKTVILTRNLTMSAHFWCNLDQATAFSGSFDGKGHTISFLMMCFPNNNNRGGGFIYWVANGSVSNLTLSNATIQLSPNSANIAKLGIVAGQGYNALFRNISVTNASIHYQQSNPGRATYMGGILGSVSHNEMSRFPFQPVTLENCTVDGLSITLTVTTDHRTATTTGAGGLIGSTYDIDYPKPGSGVNQILGCRAKNLTLNRTYPFRGSANFEGWGGMVGLGWTPVVIQDSHADKLLLNLTGGTNPMNSQGEDTGFPAYYGAGGLVGDYDEDYYESGGTDRKSVITNSSASGAIITSTLVVTPFYAGGITGINGYIEPPYYSAGGTIERCFTEMDFTGLAKTSNMNYANICGLFVSKAPEAPVIRQNLFHNWDYIALTPEPDGYAGRKLSTFAAVKTLENRNNTDLSANWGITRNVMAVQVKGYPLNYVQCSEATIAANFYDSYAVLSYEGPFSTQDADKEKVTFLQSSGQGYFPILATVQSRLGNPTWTFTEEIRVVSRAFVILALARAGGSISPLGPVEAEDGETITFTFLPDAGFELLDVIADGVSVGPRAEYSFVRINQNHTITAIFATTEGIRFQNQARLTYQDKVLRSNVTSAFLQRNLTVSKSPLKRSYSPRDRIPYLINLSNSGSTPLENLIVTDNLGGYLYGPSLLYPLSYLSGSIQYYVNGILQPAPTVIDTAPLILIGLSVPTEGTALIIFDTVVNEYAPLQVTSRIFNRVIVQGDDFITPVIANASIGTTDKAKLSISKTMSPTTLTDQSDITYTFLIHNTGNTEAHAADELIITDTFDPILQNLQVSFNGATWSDPEHYQYDAATGAFQTIAGQLTVPAASFTQDMISGAWTIHPGVSVLTVTGRV